MMKRIFASVLLIIFCLLAFSSCASNREVDQKIVYDNASVLSDAEEFYLKSEVLSLYEKTYKVSILVITTRSYNDEPEQVLEKIGFSSFDRVIAFIMYISDTKKCESEIFTYHTGTALSDSKLERMGDDTYLQVNHKEYFSAALTYLEDLDSLYKSESGQIATVVIWAIIIGLAGMAIFVLAIRSRYTKKIRSNIYPFDQYTKLNLTIERDIFLNRSVTRVRIQSSSSGGSSHHSGGRSSGRR